MILVNLAILSKTINRNKIKLNNNKVSNNKIK